VRLILERLLHAPTYKRWWQDDDRSVKWSNFWYDEIFIKIIHFNLIGISNVRPMCNLLIAYLWLKVSRLTCRYCYITYNKNALGSSYPNYFNCIYIRYSAKFSCNLKRPPNGFKLVDVMDIVCVIFTWHEYMMYEYCFFLFLIRYFAYPLINNKLFLKLYLFFHS